MTDAKCKKCRCEGGECHLAEDNEGGGIGKAAKSDAEWTDDIVGPDPRPFRPDQ